jgi:hypothetical protein
MKNNNAIVTTLAGILIGGLAYWFQPYNQSTVSGISIWAIMGIGTFLGTLLLMIFLHEKASKIALLVTLGVIIGIIARISYDLAFLDSSAHNLFPLEILFSGIITVPSAFIGVYFGTLIKKYVYRP